MQHKLLADPHILRQRLNHLVDARKSSTISGDYLEALTECRFRLAIHPSTDAGEAMSLLKLAVREDGANPKYSYHVARLYFKHGDLERTGLWLQRAIRLCSTSHRIWTHISLLQRELNLQYRGNTQYEPNALRSRSHALAKHVLDGIDQADMSLLDLKPPIAMAEIERRLRQKTSNSQQPLTSPTETSNLTATVSQRRIQETGQCRWSGIYDLEIEELLEAEPSEYNRDRLKTSFEQIIQQITSRHGGMAAFVILAIQWLVVGYPTVTIWRFITQIPPDMHSQPSWQLLNCVLRLYDTEEPDLPAMLEQMLQDQSIPPVLAAVVHRHRLLWHPLQVGVLGVPYRSAQNFFDHSKQHPTTNTEIQAFLDKKADEYVKVIELAAHNLNKSPPNKITDATAPTETPISDSEQVEYLKSETSVIQARLDDVWKQLKKFEKLDESSLVKHAHEIDEIELLVANTKDFCEKGLASINQLEANTVAADVDTVKTSLQKLAQLGRFLKSLKKIRELLPKPTIVDSPPAPLDHHCDSNDAITTPNTPLTGLQLLESKLQQIHKQVLNQFALANASFGTYSATTLNLPEIRALRLTVWALEAEALYRLGQHYDARAKWVRILREDHLNIPALKNIAVADTMTPDLGNEQVAWRAYAEILYANSIIAGNFKAHANSLSELHRNLAGAYAPPFLLVNDKIDISKISVEELVGFLTKLGRLRAWINHKLLEFLATRLELTNHSLLLGLSHGDGGSAYKIAKDKMLAFIATCAVLIPARVREAYRGLLQKTIEYAHAQRTDTSRLVARQDPSYHEQEGKLLRQIEDILRIKYIIYVALIREGEIRSDVLDYLASVTGVQELMRLDAIPMDSSIKLLQSVAGKFGLSDSSNLINLMHRLKEIFIQSLIKRGEIKKLLPLLVSLIDDETTNDVELVSVAINCLLQSNDIDIVVLQDVLPVTQAARRWVIQAKNKPATKNLTLLNTLVSHIDEVLIHFALKPIGDIEKNTNSAIQAMTNLLVIDPETSTAYFVRMNAYIKRAEVTINKGNYTIAAAILAKAKQDAQNVQDQCNNDEYKAVAKQQVDQIDEFLRAIGS